LDTLGHYRLLEPVGAGRMGEFYRARDTRAGRTVAVRVVPEEIAGNPERRAQLLRDARAAAALSHPNIAAWYETGEDRGRLFFVFEWVPGQSLRTVTGGRALKPSLALDYTVQLADALADAHAQAVLHLGINPSNIVITPKGKAKFVDFGLGAWFVPEAPYLAPEQVAGAPVDGRTDIFSLAVVLFEMLTGRPPFAGADATALGADILRSEPPAPSSLNRALPIALDAIVLRALARNVDQRCEAVTFAAALRETVALVDRPGESAGRNLTASSRGGAGASRSMRWIGVAVALVILIGALMLVAWRWLL
jgi:serine/threonine-protein kinase